MKNSKRGKQGEAAAVKSRTILASVLGGLQCKKGGRKGKEGLGENRGTASRPSKGAAEADNRRIARTIASVTRANGGTPGKN